MNDLRYILRLGPNEENKRLPVEAIARTSVHKSQTPVSLCFTQSWQPPSDIAVRDMDDRGCISQPPSDEKYGTSIVQHIKLDTELVNDKLDGGGELLGDARDLVILSEDTRTISYG
jgi:hypothetical protein